jgi:hypothetical protein
MPLHLYCVVRSDHPVRRRLDGVGDPPGPIDIVRSGELGVAASPVPEAAELTNADAVRHFDVLVDMLSDGPILPLRFGTTAPDAAAVINEVLQPAAVLYTKQLDALDGLVELRVTVVGRELDELAAVAAEHPEFRGRSADVGELDERIALGEAIGAELTRRRQERSELIIERMRPHCVSIQDQSNDDPITSRVAALVQMDQLSRVDSAATQLFNDLGAGYECEYIGPIPAADFVDIAPPRGHTDGAWGWTADDEPAGNWGWQH